MTRPEPLPIPYTQHLEACFSEALGEHRVDKARYEALLNQCRDATDYCIMLRDSGTLPVLKLPEREDDLEEIERIAEEIRGEFKHLVVLGAGGSSLGGRTLLTLTPEDGTPVQCVDSIDPVSFSRQLKRLDLKDTGFLFISKSGGTVETLAQTILVVKALEARLGKAAVAKHCRAITMPKSNPLRTLGERYGFPIYDHDPHVGGRYSVLSIVGLLPAAVAGIDIRALRQGAHRVMENSLRPWKIEEAEAARGAAMQVAWFEAGKSIHVLMPYCDRLAEFGMWHRQIWAESLGKAGWGSTPVRAMGPVDQHSQLQLYLEGPRDKSMSFIHTGVAGQGPVVDNDLATALGLDYIAGRHLGDIMAAQQRATSETLAKAGCPVRVIDVPVLDALSLGALLMHMMLETILTAELVEVNAFDQPAVEESKELARQYLRERVKAA